MLKTPVFVGIAGLVAAGALVNGVATGRWAAFTPNPERTARLHGLEVRFEGWTGTPTPVDMPTNEHSTAAARQYTAPGGGNTAVVTFISGPPGSVSTHTPDVCYPGSGYRTSRAVRKDTTALPGGRTATFYVADFEKTTQTQQHRARVRWAWLVDGEWVAPDSPRWQFAKQLAAAPVLYKLYVATPLTEAAAETAEDDPTAKAFALACWTQYAAAFDR